MDIVTAEKLVYLVAAVVFIFGLKRMQHPRTAVSGNALGALGMALAVVVVLARVTDYRLLAAGLLVGTVIGAVLAVRIQMTAMPQLVALFNGFGGSPASRRPDSSRRRCSAPVLPT